jgi:sugar phosphate isomerase/epimerase
MSHVVAGVQPVLAFSTLACPEWSASAVVDQAGAFGFEAIEWRGGRDGHVPPDMPHADTVRLRDRMQDHDLTALALTTYGSLVAATAPDRLREDHALRKSLDQAALLGARFLRVFVGVPPAPVEGEELTSRAVVALESAVRHAVDVGVGLALEPHDLHVRSSAMAPILEAVASDHVGVIWDVGNAWAIGEGPEEGLRVLAPWITYVQLKDGRGIHDSWQLCGLGEGDVPLERAIRALRDKGPLPPLSIEWERAWDRSLAPPEIALPAALEHIRSILRDVVEPARTAEATP